MPRGSTDSTGSSGSTGSGCSGSVRVPNPNPLNPLNPLNLLNPVSPLPVRRGRLRGCGRLGRGLALRLRGLRIRLGAAGALHVDAAAEMGAFGDRHARGGDVAVNRAVVSEIH